MVNLASDRSRFPDEGTADERPILPGTNVLRTLNSYNKVPYKTATKYFHPEPVRFGSALAASGPRPHNLVERIVFTRSGEDRQETPLT